MYTWVFCLLVCLRATSCGWCPQRPQEDIRSSGTGDSVVRCLPCGCWALDLCLLQEQLMFLTAEPSVYSSKWTFERSIFKTYVNMSKLLFMSLCVAMSVWALEPVVMWAVRCFWSWSQRWLQAAGIQTQVLCGSRTVLWTAELYLQPQFLILVKTVSNWLWYMDLL